MMRVLLVDDHTIVRAGLRRLLTALPQMEVEEATNAEGAMAALGVLQPELVILDLDLPGLGGLSLLRQMLRNVPGLRVMVLTMHSDPFHSQRAMEAGARGFLSKNVAPEELLLAVQRVAAGDRYIEGEIAQAMALRSSRPDNTMGQLSPRDLEIMRLLASGHSLQQIADQLGISYKTVANGCTSIKAKLGVARTADLIRLAMQAGF